MPMEQLRLLGRIELVYWMGGTKHPLTGQHAVDVLTGALVEVLTGMEPLYPKEPRPVLDRAERIYHRVHKAVENEFQSRWKRHAFER